MFSSKHKKQGLLKSFCKNDEGNLALTFALSLTVIVGAVGAATDFSALSSAKSKSQSIADNTALTAAIYIKDHNRPPNTDAEGYRDGAIYTAADLGYNFTNSVAGGADSVTVSVDYDDNAKEAVVTVKGETTPNFTQIFGKQTLAFSSTSVVSYLEAADSFPASISLVLDNSGSMQWDDKLATQNGRSPAGAAPRIDGLTKSVSEFTRALETRLDLDNQPYETIRMGMLPYNGELIERDESAIPQQNRNGFVSIKAGYLSDTDINAMRPGGSTNSNPPMERALADMQDEDQAHRDAAEIAQVAYREPLKFVIFMSDGQNTSGKHDFTPDESSNFAFIFNPEIDDYIGGEYPLVQVVTRIEWRRNRRGRWVRVRVRRNVPGPTPPPGYRRGSLSLATDRLTIESCQTLHAQNVEIFTIGYGLEVGNYNANDQRIGRQADVGTVSEANQAAAFNLLRTCSSQPENFVRADNNEELEAAFDTIQNAIIEELIRIKS